jgi:EAL domain-containing protein (putative c-di-GMP-specific phosphodiesterase class I)
MAEENGSLMEIGLWVIEAACSQLRTWRLANPNRPSLEMSINLSARQLQQGDFVERVDEILKRTALEPHFVRLEITESVLVRDNVAAIQTLAALKRLGVKLAIDDFGTGHSSLSHLRNLTVDSIKIDQSFIDGLHKDESNSFIVQGIVTMAHDLGLAVTAEGIETEEQLTFLRELGCDRGQGFHLARPLSSEVVDALISDRRLRTVRIAEEPQAAAVA